MKIESFYKTQKTDNYLKFFTLTFVGIFLLENHFHFEAKRLVIVRRCCFVVNPLTGQGFVNRGTGSAGEH
jgi:hypothetical protein